MLALIFFKILPEAKVEREASASAFLAALNESNKDNAKTRAFIRAAMLVLSDKCPSSPCPFKAEELKETI